MFLRRDYWAPGLGVRSGKFGWGGRLEGGVFFGFVVFFLFFDAPVFTGTRRVCWDCARFYNLPLSISRILPKRTARAMRSFRRPRRSGASVWGLNISK